MKKLSLFLILILLAAALTGCSGTDNNGDETESESETQAETEQVGHTYDEMSELKSQRTACLYDDMLLDIKCNGVSCLYDESQRMYFISAYGCKNWNDLDIEFVCSDRVTDTMIVDADFVGKEMSEVTKSNAKIYVMAYNDTEFQLQRISFTTLPILTLKSDDLYVRRGESNPFDWSDTRMYMTLMSGTEQKESFCDVHMRGGTSTSFPKTGLKIELVDEEGNQVKEKLLGMRKDDDWILTPMYTDESKLRDKLSSDLWMEIGAKNNPYGMTYGFRTEYIEVFVNDIYWGLFGLTTPIDAKATDLDYENGEILTKIVSWSCPSPQRLSKIRGGDSCEAIVIKKPDKTTGETWTRLAEYYTYTEYGRGDDFVNNVANYVDIDNMIDYWIFLNVICGPDNAYKNTFICYKNTEDGGFKGYIAPWDCDISFGITWVGTTPLYWIDDTENSVNRILDILGTDKLLKYDVENYRSRLAARWEELRKGVLDEQALLDRVDRLDSLIRDSGAYAREVERWPSGGHCDDTSFIKNYITRRLERLDRFIDELK